MGLYFLKLNICYLILFYKTHLRFIGFIYLSLLVMRIGVTNLFKGSAFGGALPQVALNIATALKDAGHDVCFLLPSESEPWFIDCTEASVIPCVRLAEGERIETFHMVIEVVWFLPFQVRQQIAQKVVMFYHYPPAFYDIESSTYPLSTMIRDFNGVSALWTWSHFKATDYAYLEFLSRKPVFKCPFFWNPQLLDTYIKEASVPDYVVGVDRKIVICESNQTNTSNCTLPMVILSEIYKNDNKQKWRVLNSEELCKREFFINNILKNLHIGGACVDISGNFMKRIRLPDLCRESNYIISHQRFRPLKYMLLDALWLGIPLIHNCELLKDVLGGSYYYELNRIGQALTCWRKITTDARPDLSLVRAGLLAKWGPSVGSGAMNGLVESVFSWVPPVIPVRVTVRIAFFDMWVDFQPVHNLFLEAFAQNGFNVVNDQADPTHIVFGPFGDENTNVKWSLVPKVFYTGENLPPLLRNDVVLNIGFSHKVADGVEYLRLPNWFLELNWYNQDAGLIKNPVPFSLDLLKAPVTMREKFCIFVASNQNSVNRNTLFNVVSRYKHVESAGVLFNNCFQIPGGPGGSGGQVAKVEAYKGYKFALVCENSKSVGYVTEKLLHAKLAGCVPIYWGDPEVAFDFNNDSFINVADYFSADALLSKIKQLDNDAGGWLNMATAPLLVEGAIDKCKELLGTFAKKLMDIKPLVAAPQSNVSALNGGQNMSAVDRPKISSYGMTPIVASGPQVIVTCCNGKYVDSAVRLIKSSKVPVYVWVWDIEFMEVKKLTKAGAKLVTPLDTKWNPQWADFWNPAHYAWKPLVMVLANSTLPKGTQVLYLDSGIEIVDDLTAVWTNIGRDGFFVCKMPEHKMATWCHPKFCSLLAVTPLELIEAQISANIVGFIAGNEVATNILGQTLGSACNPEIIVGQKWHQYSNVCIGHRHDQSILSLYCIRAGIKMHILDMFAGWKSYDETLKYGQVLYVHRGNWRQVTPPEELEAIAPVTSVELKGFSDCLVVNLAHRQDRLEKFWSNQPYLKGRAKRLDAVNGRTLVLTPDICNLFKNNDFKWKKSVMGCALSHFAIWKQMSGLPLMGSAGHTLVLEDDAQLVDGFVEKWNVINGLVPQDADIIFLGGVLPPNKPGLPMVTEPVNAAFAKVAVNEMFGSKRRYFHFCTYAYVLTNTGAQKLCSLISNMGIYTSADHMLVNNMDLLNVYFTTPLLAGCIQDNDPIYQNADFNNFNRVDKFDSEIWNNTDCFTPEEVMAVTGSGSSEKISVVFFEHEQYKQCIDAQWLSEIFQREFVWTEHTATIKSGSKVIVYYQHTTPVALIEGWINRNADCQIYLLHASDESCKADVSLYRHPAVRCVFRNYWRPECVTPNVVHLPLGYLNGKRGTGKVLVASQRPVDWSFAGAMDRNNRKAVIEDLQKRYPKNKVHLTMTWGSSDNLGVEKYVALLDESKFVPCLDGFFNTESYRFYEALEHGALPIVCLDEKRSYENILCGLPLLSVGSWSDAVDFDWDVKQKEILYAWVNYKVGLTKLINEKLA